MTVSGSGETRALLDAVGVGIVTLDHEFRILAANAAAAHMLGRAATEFTWMPVQQLFHGGPVPVPGDPPSAALVYDASGVPLPVSAALNAYDAAGRRGYVLTFTRDAARPAAPASAVSSDRTSDAVIDHSAVGITLTASDRRWARTNQAYCDMLGYSAEELHSLDFRTVTHPDDRARDSAALARLDAGETTHFAHEKRYIRRDGSVLWARIHVAGIYEGERLTHYVTHVVDISAEREAVRESRTLRAQLHAFIDHVPAHITMKDAVGRYTLVNRAFADASRASPASFVGKRPVDIGAGGHDETQSETDESAVLREGAIIEREVVPDWDPGRVLAETLFPVRDSGGAIVGSGSIAVDITRTLELQEEARRRGERLADVIAATDAGTWEWDVRTGMIAFDDRWADIAGYTPAEIDPPSIAAMARYVHAADIGDVRRRIREHFRGEDGTFVLEFRVRHKDGRWVWVEDHGKVIERDDDGRPRRIAGIRIDISRRKAAEQALLETNEALQRSNVELERFAYVASHDLQEPLRMVASFTQLLQNKYADRLDDTAKEYIHFAFDGARRLQQLIRELLAYSRLGSQEIEEAPVDVHALVARVQQSMQLAISESGATVRCRSLPVVRGDRSQLFRLLQNLISNAIKYRGEAPPEIEIGTRDVAGEIVFYVSDNGIGIDAGDAERVFEVFQRLHRRAKSDGTGIGLSVCKRVVERHGGRIWLESRPGDGTSFLFTLAPDRFRARPAGEGGKGSTRSVA